jgi:transcriptional regulator with XRE-family HTH domain
MLDMSFAERLRRLRLERGLTWYRLAKLSGVTKQGLAKLERPGSDPRLSTLRKLAKAFGLSLSELVEGETAKPKRPAGASTPSRSRQ